MKKRPLTREIVSSSRKNHIKSAVQHAKMLTNLGRIATQDDTKDFRRKNNYRLTIDVPYKSYVSIKAPEFRSITDMVERNSPLTVSVLNIK